MFPEQNHWIRDMHHGARHLRLWILLSLKQAPSKMIRRLEVKQCQKMSWRNNKMGSAFSTCMFLNAVFFLTYTQIPFFWHQPIHKITAGHIVSSIDIILALDLVRFLIQFLFYF